MTNAAAADSHKIALTQEKETLLITLYAKAGESERPDSLLRDTAAAEAVRRIDYDFAKLKVTGDMMVGLAMRARALDDWVRDFIRRNPEGCVLHLGCGLDTRVFRVDPPPQVAWFEVDYPEVIDIRRSLYPEHPGCTLIGSSVTDTGWLEAVPRDRPVMVVAEGLVMYLDADEIRRLFTAIVAHAPRGEMAFDAFSQLGVWFVQYQPSVRATGAKLKWGIDAPEELEQMVPSLRFVEEVPAFDLGEIDRFSLASQASIRLMLALPWLRRMGRFLRYDF